VTRAPRQPADRRPPATLNRDQRVRRTAGFQAAYAAKGRAADGRLVVYARVNGLGRTRLGLSVGARIGGSVVRNRVKRLLREAFRQARADFPTGYDIVIVPLAADYTFQEIDRRLRALVPAAVRRFGEMAARGAPPAAGGV
jgi:ribonuclease P protein component